MNEQPENAAVDAVEIQEAFKNIFWTRLVVVPEALEADEGQIQETIDRKFALAPDIIEECTAVAEMAEQPDWAPLFEPNDFNEQHKPLTLDQFKLPEEELEHWGEQCN